MARQVIVQGIGPVGRGIAEAAQAAADLEVMAVVDHDPALVGRRALDGVPEVFETLAGARLHAPDAELVLHATSSKLEPVAEQLLEAVGLGLSVVSTCEELVWPWARHPDLAARLHRRALGAGLALIGTGVNPGFIMDRLPVLLGAASRDVRRVVVERMFDPRPRREPFRDKVGVGLCMEDFEAALQAGRIGHVGLEESGRMVAAGLGLGDLTWEQTLEPVRTRGGKRVRGLVQVLQGTGPGGSVTLRFESHEGVARDLDRIVLEGVPPVSLVFEGGLAGEEATVSCVLQAARLLPAAPRGLITVLDLPLRAG